METVVCRHIEAGILEVRMNRPDRLNALNPALIADLIAVFKGLQHDRQTRVVILTGEGKGFCSGADLQEQVVPGGIPGTEGMSPLGFVYKFQEHLAELMLAIHECDKPVIAAVNGAAVGGGVGHCIGQRCAHGFEQGQIRGGVHQNRFVGGRCGHQLLLATPGGGRGGR